MQMSNMDCLQFGWFKHGRVNHNNLAVYDILLHFTNAADNRSEYIMFLGQLEIFRLWIFLINIRMENNGITSETLTKRFASFAAKNSKISVEIKRGS